MLTLQRQEAILVLLEENRSVSVQALAKHFFVSEATIRRDLERLARDGLVKRTYGGAVLLGGRASEPPLLMREGENVAQKERIAQFAISLVENNNVVMMDSSSTVLRLVPLLSRFERITAITHGLKTSLLLHELPQVTVHCAGGRLQENTLSLVGSATCTRIAELNADIAFFSCRGFSLERGVTDASEDEAQIKRCMIASSRKSVLLCDQSKLDRAYLMRVCDADALYAIVCDTPLPQDLHEELLRRNVRVLVP